MPRHRTKLAGERAGTTLFLTLGVLTVVLSLSLLITRSLVSLHRERRLQHDRLQASFLVEAGLQRAAARLAAGDDYRGEVWKVSPEESRLPGQLEVDIRVTEAAGARRIQVEARTGAGAQRVVAVGELEVDAVQR